LDGKTALAKKRKMFLKFTFAVLSIDRIDFHEIDAENCDGKLKEYFPEFLTQAVFHPILQLFSKTLKN